jgi:hypothetical protein
MDEDFVSGSGGVASLPALVVPALRKVREGRVTHCVGEVSEIKNLGHPLHPVYHPSSNTNCPQFPGLQL